MVVLISTPIITSSGKLYIENGYFRSDIWYGNVYISGGTFREDPREFDEVTIEEGCEIIENGPINDRTYIVNQLYPSVDNVSDFGAFTSGLNGASGRYTLQSKTYKLITNITTDGYLYVPADVEAVIDLNGYNIDRGLNSAITYGYVIEVNGKLTVKDSKGTGKITGGKNTAAGGGVDVAAYGSFILESGTISGNETNNSGGGVSVNGNGSFIMNGGSISENSSASYGGGVFLASPNETFTMNAGTISGNSATSLGCGVHFGLRPGRCA